MSDLPQKCTTKKLKYVGQETVYNATTGEAIQLYLTQQEERDFNFKKVWFKNFLQTLDLIGNKKTKVAYWIIDNLDKENKLCATFRKICKETNCSMFTVTKTMTVLQEADFLRSIQNGVYVVNPDIVFKGSKNARLNILTQYQELGYEPPELSKEQQIKQLQEAIEGLQKQLNKLTQEECITCEVEPQLEFSADGNVVERAKEIKTNE